MAARSIADRSVLECLEGRERHAQPFQLGNQVAVRVDKASREDGDKLIVRDLDTAREPLRVRECLDHGGLSCPVGKTVDLQEGGAGGVSQDLVLGACEAQGLHPDIPPPVGVRATLQIVALAEPLHRQRQCDLKLVEIAAQAFQRLVERQRGRKVFALQGRVSGIHDELRACQQVL